MTDLLDDLHGRSYLPNPTMKCYDATLPTYLSIGSRILSRTLLSTTVLKYASRLADISNLAFRAQMCAAYLSVRPRIPCFPTFQPLMMANLGMVDALNVNYSSVWTVDTCVCICKDQVPSMLMQFI